MYRQVSGTSDEQIRIAAGRCAEQARLRAKRDGLASEVASAEQAVARASKRVVSEDANVERYQHGVWAFVYELFADGEGRVSKEQQEAAAARIAFQEAVLHHRRLRDEHDDVDRRLAAFDGADATLAEAQGAKLDELMARGGPVADELLALDDEAAALRVRLVQVDEAQVAGGNVRTTVARVRARIEEAGRWRATDLLGDSGGVADARSDRIDNARNLIGVAQAELTIFQRELADVGLTIDAQLGAVPQRNLLDTLLNDIFATGSVGESLAGSSATTTRVLTAVDEVLALLGQERARLEARAAHLDASLAALTQAT